MQINQSSQVIPIDQRWTAFAESIPQANIFHHPAWINLLAKSYDYHPFVFALIDQNETIYAGLPFIEVNSFLTGKRWVSLPFTDYCQPLYRNRENLEALSMRLMDLSQNEKTPPVEVRWELPSLPAIHSCSHHVQHTLNLDQGLVCIYKSLHRTQRQNIKIAEKNNVQIRRGDDEDSLRVFYHLHCLTRHRQGVPVQPWHFFELLYERLIAQGLGFFLLAYVGDQCLAAGLFLHWNKTLIYKYASSSDEGQDLRPNHLLTWTAICWGCENGYKVFDFGRTDVANEGLRTFKLRWGADENPIYYSTTPANSFIHTSGKLEGMMYMLIRNSPIWVCRSVGELLYRHFG